MPVTPPTGLEHGIDRRTARDTMLLAPLAVLPLGAVVALVCWLGPHAGLPPLVVGVLAVLALVLGNRAFHVDGLSDTADGLTASYDAERSLAVMRTGTSGPAGGAAVFLVLALQAVSLASLPSSVQGAVLAGLAVCVSRCALTVTCADGVRSARAGGLGDSFCGSVPRPLAGLVWLVAAVLLAATATWAGLDWWRGEVAALVALAALGLLVRRADRRLGGVTGDVFGAAVEVALAAILVVLA